MARVEDKDADREPRTAGELRRRLAERGEPWSVDERLTDVDPLPVYQRGGEIVDPIPGVEPLEDDVTETLRREPPTNPLVREHWVETGVLPEAGPEQAPEDEERQPPDRSDAG
jgi:hypothetical protein